MQGLPGGDIGHPFMEEKPKLNIGGGTGTPLEGYTVVDRTQGTEAYPLDYPDNSVQEIYASHVLEHFGHREAIDVLRDWARVLVPGGRLRIAVPDFAHVLRKYADKEDFPVLEVMYGGQTDENDYHKSGYDEEGLRVLLRAVGLVAAKQFESFHDDCSSYACSLNMEAWKPTPTIDEEAIGQHVGAIMSVPRLGFTDNMFSATHVAVDLGIRYERVTGAFWGACLERGMEVLMGRGLTYILTVDYDTVYNADDVRRLVMLMDQYPELDALAAIQVRRENDYVLASTFEGQEPDVMGDHIPVRTAHFGLTLIRASSLEGFPHPWFEAVPNADGRWGDGRVDEDVNFWVKWHEAGKTLSLAPTVKVGHLQMLISWPGAGGKPIHQYVNDYTTKGRPKQARV